MRNGASYQDITRTTLAVLWIGVLIVAAFWIVKPFLLAMVWASMIVAATWPVLLGLEKLLWGRRGLAATAMTLLLVLVFVLPLTAAMISILGNTDRIAGWITSLETLAVPPPPDWVANLPFVGSKLSTVWRDAAAAGPAGLPARLAPYTGKIVSWFVAHAGSVGRMAFDILLTVIIAGILYATGGTAAQGVVSFARRLAGRRGEEVAVLAAKAVRGVALGVVATAVIQATLSGIGLFVTGVPAAPLLTAVIFILCLAQLGPVLVLIPAVIWLFWSGHAPWGTVLAIWTIPVITLDNVLRPVLIKKGADLPLLLVFAGVIGGLMALGMIGIFIGPVVLAVAHALLKSWIEEGETRDARPERSETRRPNEPQKNRPPQVAERVRPPRVAEQAGPPRIPAEQAGQERPQGSSHRRGRRRNGGQRQQGTREGAERSPGREEPPPSGGE
jgi:predicted PurR-regulated permease PerM